MIELIAGKDDAGRRLDRIIRKALPDLSLSLIHRLLRQKKILVDNKPASPNSRIDQGMTIKVIADVNHETDTVNKTTKNVINQRNLHVNKTSSLKTPKLQYHSSRPQTPNPRPQSPVPILWQGAGIIVFNKPSGLSTHGPNSLDTIVSDWLAGRGSPLPRSLSFKPGPLHRLDKPTSGAIVFSKTLEGAKMFSALLREHKLEKTYLAIVEGQISSEKTWQDTLEREKNTSKSLIKPALSIPTPDSRFPTPTHKEAITAVKTLASKGGYSLIEARIMTGRHHQIRAQAASHGHPLAGDIKYGGKPFPGSEKARSGCFFLHAWKIRFLELPDGFTGVFPGFIAAPLPEAFLTQIKALFSMEAIRGVVQETGKGR